MMKTFLRLLAAAALLAAAPSFAQDSAKLRASLKSVLPPEAKIESVRKTPYGGLYEVVVNGEIVYADEAGSFILMGQLVDMKTKENVTELRMRDVSRVNFKELPLDSAFKIVRGNGARKVAMFADPNCGYCKRFERDLLSVDNITVYVFLYPILAPDSVEKSKVVWCAADRGKAWLDYMVRDLPLSGDNKCATPIEKNLAFGQSKKIQGTPTLFLEDGERIPGVIPIPELEKRLAAVKPGAAKSPS